MSRRPDRGVAPQARADARADPRCRNRRWRRGSDRASAPLPVNPDQEAHRDEADDWPLDPCASRAKINPGGVAGAHSCSRTRGHASPSPTPRIQTAGRRHRSSPARTAAAPGDCGRGLAGGPGRSRRLTPSAPGRFPSCSRNCVTDRQSDTGRRPSVALAKSRSHDLLWMLLGGTIWGLLASGTIIVVPPRWYYRMAGAIGAFRQPRPRQRSHHRGHCLRYPRPLRHRRPRRQCRDRRRRRSNPQPCQTRRP